jgi:hypothetical protein
MKRTLLVFTALLATSTSASAGTYLGLGFGTDPAVNDQFRMSTTASPEGRSLRGLVGFRFGNFAIEGTLNGFGVRLPTFGAQRVYQASVAAKLSVPLANNFEAFGRGGLERTWLNIGDERYDYMGDGYLLGAGFEFRLNAVLANASLFVDYTIHQATLLSPTQEVDASSRMWALGFTVGI